MNPETTKTKKDIEERYRRLSLGERNTGLEYLEPEIMRQVISKYYKITKDMNDEEIRKFYSDWKKKFNNTNWPEPDIPDISES